MNILQLHDMVKFWIDEYGSPRQEDYQIDQALWSSAKAITEERYDHSKQNHMGDSIERTQRVRDELYTLVYKTPFTTPGNLSITDNLISADQFPEIYKYLLALEVLAKPTGDPEAGDEWHLCESVPIDWKRDWLTRNPYRKPKTGAFERQYYEQTIEGFRIHSDVPALNHARLTYMKEPEENYIGQDRIPYVPTVDTPIISTGNITYLGDPYTRGDMLTIPAGGTWTGEKALVFFVDTDLQLTVL